MTAPTQPTRPYFDGEHLKQVVREEVDLRMKEIGDNTKMIVQSTLEGMMPFMAQMVESFLRSWGLPEFVTSAATSMGSREVIDRTVESAGESVDKSIESTRRSAHRSAEKSIDTSTNLGNRSARWFGAS